MIRIATTENSTRLHHYQSVIDDPEFEFTDELKPPYDDEKLANVDALIVSCEHFLNSRLALFACKQKGIPTFHIIDGIVEWRNLFDNPRTSNPENGAPLFRPLIADFTFALGSFQHQVLSWLGNQSVVLTGLPRLDSLTPRPCRRGATSKPSVLIATANTPWFSEEQKQILIPAFRGLAKRTAEFDQFQFQYRVAESLRSELAVEVSDVDRSAAEALEGCSALITTPSSLAIEAMALGVPTMIFDPYNCPQLNQAAWYSNSVDGVFQNLESLMAPSENLASFQDWLADKSALCDGAAAKRISEFIKGRLRGEPLAQDSADMGESKTLRPDSNSIEVNASDILNTLPALESKLARQQNHIFQLENALARPTFRNVVGTIMRFGKTQLGLDGGSNEKKTGK